MKANQNIPTDVFKFVNVRPPEMISSDKLEKKFLKHPVERISDTDFWKSPFMRAIEKHNGETLYNKLKDILRKNPTDRAGVDREVAAWSSPFRFRSIDSVYDTYSGLKGIANRLRTNKDQPIAPDSIAALMDVFWENLYILNGRQDDTDSKRAIRFDIVDFELRLWDNFICQVIDERNGNLQLRDELLFLLKVAYFIEYYEAVKESDVKLMPATALKRTVVLPKIFPLPAATKMKAGKTPENTGSDAGRPPSATLKKKTKGLQVFIGGSLIHLDDICTNQLVIDPCTPHGPAPMPYNQGHVKMLGVGDLLVVKKQLIKYEAGEIAHIENVMASEMRKRSTRKLEREEEKSELESESEAIAYTEKETTTSGKYDLEHASSEILVEDSSLEAGLNTTALLGIINATASLNFAHNYSAEESNKVAQKMSKETISRAVNRISQRVRELRSKLTIKETEEKNQHEFDNSSPDSKNLTGIYQFVDKIYRLQVYKYDARPFVELIVPRPAAQYIYFKANSRAEGNVLVKPVHPKNYTDESDSDLQVPLTSHEIITEANYLKWAAVYNIEVTAPPPSELLLTASINFNIHEKRCMCEHTSINIPEGYKAFALWVAPSGYADSNIKTRINDKFFEFNNPDVDTAFANVEWTGTVQITVQTDAEAYELPLPHGGTYFQGPGHGAVGGCHYGIKCKNTELNEKQWKLEVYNAILDAYQKQLEAYESKLADMEFMKTNFGNNPNINRMIEAEEIKKGCIQLITNQNFGAFGALQYNSGDFHYPEFDNTEAQKEGAYIQFFEQAFEWTQMTYWFYPYFWGNKPQWTIIKQYEDNDPLFTKFLQAGAVRVMLPVRPAYKEAVQYYLSTGQIWDGGDTPVIDDPLYLSIVDEMMEADGQTNALPLEGSVPWEIKMPTNFVLLNKEVDLPKFPVHKPFIIDANHDHIDDYYEALAAPVDSVVEPEIYYWN